MISSERDATVAKHGSQMGAYTLHGAKSGRPVSAGCSYEICNALCNNTAKVIIMWEVATKNYILAIISITSFTTSPGVVSSDIVTL